MRCVVANAVEFLQRNINYKENIINYQKFNSNINDCMQGITLQASKQPLQDIGNTYRAALQNPIQLSPKKPISEEEKAMILKNQKINSAIEEAISKPRKGDINLDFLNKY